MVGEEIRCLDLNIYMAFRSPTEHNRSMPKKILLTSALFNSQKI